MPATPLHTPYKRSTANIIVLPEHFGQNSCKILMLLTLKMSLETISDRYRTTTDTGLKKSVNSLSLNLKIKSIAFQKHEPKHFQ